MYLQTVSNQIFSSQNIQPMANSLYINPFLNKPLFLCACSADFLKHWEKEKLFRNKQFSYFPSVFYPSVELSAIFMPKIVVCKLFNLFSNKPWVYVSAVQVFENTVRKGEIALIEQFRLFLHCFLPFNRTFRHFIKSKIVVCKQ